ncbi:hypothetical protein N7E81_05155 [Reichenbachiella carrageenanivorans]|uniref:Lipoprotein n=1 Tax=Reichenbachiella carrageenanivorans TaxID=2979869 RepID=A0ABY6D2U5_9BACT|nr:hypothetical protein [Reichenbachiella carrageenanivorans]UXX80485.1 hypothetical protein N7E81_05155 [Reichenbachiella carrageenanivorans]
MNIYRLICAVLILTACHDQNKNTISTVELMKTQEIKKVTEAEILQGGSLIGGEVMKVINQVIQKNINPDSPTCDISKWDELDTLAQFYKVEIDKVGNQTPNKSDLEFQLLEAYQYNLENDLTATAAVQKADRKTVLYAYPIAKNDLVYKYCMDSTQQTKAEMWRLKIPIKEIILRL